MKAFLLFLGLFVSFAAYPDDGIRSARRPGTYLAQGINQTIFITEQGFSFVYYERSKDSSVFVTRVDLVCKPVVLAEKESRAGLLTGDHKIKQSSYEDLILSTKEGPATIDFINGDPYLTTALQSIEFNGAHALVSVSGKLFFDVGGKLYPFPFSLTYEDLKDHRAEVNLPLIEADHNDRWATFLGGTVNDDILSVVSKNSLVYVCGSTQSSDLPVSVGTFQDTLGGYYDAMVSCYSRSGIKKWTTYLGGANLDIANSIAADSAGNCYIAGYTNSLDFPAFNTPQTVAAGSYDGFVVKFDSTGNAVFSGMFGGSAGDFIYGLAVDPYGSVFVGGGTTSQNLPVQASSFQTSHAGAIDAFVARFSNTFQLDWCTYFGGAGSEDMHSMSGDADGSVVFCGGTYSPDFPTQNAMQPFTAGGADVYVAKLDSTGGLVFSTYYGGAAHDDAFGITTDENRNVYITGYTPGNDLPVGSNPYQSVNHGGFDSYLIRLSALGAFNGGSYFGGSSDDQASGISYGKGLIFLGGSTFSTDLPVDSAAAQQFPAGGFDAFYAVFDTTLNYVASSFYGGVGTETCFSVSFDHDSIFYLAGKTTSSEIPYINFGDQENNAGGEDGFLVRISYINSPNATGSIDFSEKLKVYPVPFTSHTSISSDEVITTVRIMNAIGAEVFMKEVRSTFITLDLSFLESGTYFILTQLESGEVKMRKVIRN